MKSCLALIFSFLLCITSKAQIDFNPEVIIFEIDENNLDAQVSMTITNNYPETKSLYWKFEEGINFPDEWAVSVKDYNLCYSFGSYENHPDIPNIIDSGDTIIFYFRIKSNDDYGLSYGILSLYTDNLFMDKIASTSSPINSVENSDRDEPQLFPNPVKDIFSILNDSEVKTIEILNLNGQVAKTANHLINHSHSIIDLPTGTYILALKNENGDMIKTLNLLKE